MMDLTLMAYSTMSTIDKLSQESLIDKQPQVMKYAGGDFFSGLSEYAGNRKLHFRYISFSLTMMYYIIFQQNVHTVCSPCTRIRFAVLYQPVDKFTTHKTTGEGSEVIPSVTNHNWVFLGVQAIPKVFSN